MPTKMLSIFLAAVLLCSMIPLAPQVLAVASAGEVVLSKTATPLTPERTSEISLSVVGTPLTSSQAVDIVLVLDVSPSMDTALGTSTRMGVMKAAAKSFISEVLPAGSNNKVSLVAFSGVQNDAAWNDGKIVQTFSNSISTLNTSIDNITNSVNFIGYTNMEAGFYHADGALDAANGARTTAKKVVVYMSDGAANLYYNATGNTVYNTTTSVTEAIGAAQTLLTNHPGTLVYTVGLSDGTNSADIAKVLNASNQGLYPTKYFDVNSADGLTSVYNYLADTINQIANTAMVTDLLPDGVTFDGFIATPYGTTASAAGNTVTWTIPVITTSPLTLTYRVKVDESIYGGVYTNTKAEIAFKPIAENHFYDAVLTSGYANLTFPKPIIPAPPIANDDAYVSISGNAVIVSAAGILSNDEAVDLRANGDGTTATPVSGSVSLVSGPSHGSLALNADGSFTYLPTADYEGIDTFVYKIFSDVTIIGQGTVRVEDTATVTITSYPEGMPGEIDLSKNANSTATDREFEVTLTAVGNKPETAPPTDYILVMDVSNSMRYLLNSDVEGTPSRLSVMKEAAAVFVSEVLAAGNDNRVAVVSYSSDITGATTDRWNDSVINQGFSSNATTVNAAIAALIKRNATNTEAGFYNADNVLDTARAAAQKIVVFMSDGGANQYYDSNGNTIGVGSEPFNQTATNEAIASAKLLKANHPGTQIFTMGIGQDLYGYIAKVMNPAAPDDYQEKFFQVLTASDASAIYTELTQPSSTIATDAVVTDILPAGVSYAGSLTASAGTTATINGNTITWTLGSITDQTATLTYRVKVDDSIYGGVYTNQSAVLKFRPAIGSPLYTPDTSGFAYLDYPLPIVAVGPLAVDDAYSVDESQTLTIPAPGVLANDPTTILRADGSGTTATATNQSVSLDVAPVNGTLTQNANGSFSYTPVYGFYGIDTFVYRVFSDVTIDGKGTVRLEDTAVVTIMVNYVNDAPVAADDEAATQEEQAVTIPVLTNDSDPDGDNLTVTAITQPANGSAVKNAEGTVTYTPKANFSGTDTLTYTISDGNGKSDTAIVTILVGEVNDAPIANDDIGNTPEDTPVAISVLTNDTDVDGGALSITSATNPAHGAAVINADGTMTYVPDANYFGTDTFEYTITDGRGGSDTARVTITVTPVNDAPIANDDTRNTPEDTAIKIGVLSNDADVEGSPLTVIAVTEPTHGAAVIQPNGTVTYTPHANFNGIDTFIYTISDGQGGSDTATVTVNVIPINDAPLATDDTATTPEDMPVNVNVLANDHDVDGNPLIVTLISDPTHGSAVINPDGTVTYTPDINTNGTDTFEYTVSDGQGGTDTATVTITVTPLNDAPVAVNDIRSTPEDTTLIIDVLTNDSDPDGDPLTVIFVSEPAHGSATINPDGTITYKPDSNYIGDDTLIYTVSDGQGGICTASVTITVGGVNDAPVAADDTRTTPEDTSIKIDVLTNDTDSDGDALAVVSITDPANGTAVINTDGTVTYTPAADFNGTDSFDYTITDGNGGTDTATVTVTILSINDAPVAADDTAIISEDTPITIAVLTNDKDADHDPLTVVSVTDPAHGSVVINPDGTVTYTPDANFIGTDTFEYTVSDGHGGTDTAIVTITVNPINDAPVAVNDARTTPEDTLVIIDVLTNDSDPDGDALTVISTSTPANGNAVINANGTVNYTPNANFNGTDSFTYTISDGQGGIATATVSITVTSVNDGPVAADDARTTPEDVAVNVDVLTNDSDVDGDLLTVTGTTNPTNGTALINPDGTITYTPDVNFFGTDTFDYTISDGNGGTDTATVTVNVSRIIVPDIKISKQVLNSTQSGIFADMADLYVGETAQYLIIVENNGNTPLINVMVTDNHAPDGTVVTASNGDSLMWTHNASGIASLNLGDLAVGEKIELRYDYVTSTSDLENSTVINRADVVATPEIPSNLSEVTDFATAIINISATPLSVSGISVDNQVKNLTSGGPYADLASGIVGDTFRYNVTVKNTGLLDLTAVKVYDNRVVPGTVITNVTAGTTAIWQTSVDGRAYFVLGNLAPGALVNFTYDVITTSADANNIRLNTTQAIGIVTITMNDQQIVELSDDAIATALVDQIPTTGENDLTTLLGSMLLLAAAVLIFFRLRRRDRGLPSDH